MERADLVRRVWSELEPELAELGFELIEVEFGRHGSTDILRLFVDRQGGVTIDDCASASRAVGAVLDQRDLIEGQYTLEVSSPGIARPLRRPQDFAQYTGERVKVRTVEPVGGRNRISGVLAGYEDGLVLVKTDKTDFRIHIENVKRAHLDR